MTFRPSGTPAAAPVVGPIVPSNPGQTVEDMQAGLNMVKAMDTQYWTPGAFTPPTNLVFQYNPLAGQAER